MRGMFILFILTLVFMANNAQSDEIFSIGDFRNKCNQMAKDTTSGVDCAQKLRDVVVEARSNGVNITKNDSDACLKQCINTVEKQESKNRELERSKLPKLTDDISQTTLNNLIEMLDRRPTTATAYHTVEAYGIILGQEMNKASGNSVKTLPSEKQIRIFSYIKQQCDEFAMMTMNILIEKGVEDITQQGKHVLMSSKLCYERAEKIIK